MKKLLLVFAILILLGYLMFASLYFEDNTQRKECENFKVLVKDSVDKQFIQPEDIELLLKKAELHPVGQLLAEVNTMEMEKAISANKLVKNVDVYITHNGSVVARVYQRNPILRII